MSKSLILALIAIAACTAPAAAQEKIELFADEARSSCSVSDTAPSSVSLHVFLTGPNSATLAAFRCRIPDCWQGATWVADVTPYVSVGGSQGEMSVAFGQCLTPPIHMVEIVVATTGSALPCCKMVIEQPVSFPLQYVDCAFAETDALAGQAVTINPDATCPCLVPLAAEPSTWGRVKSLYR